MARLAVDTFVKDPTTRLMVHLRAGEEPAPAYAALVKNPDVWEDGTLPTPPAPEDDKPAAKKTAAKKPAAGGRATAEEGDSGS